MDNILLAALDRVAGTEFLTDRKLVLLPQGKMLYSPNDPVETVYFPTTSIVSLLHFLEDGSSIEVGVIGCEGFLGLSALMKDQSSSLHALVQGQGYAWSLPYSTVKALFDKAENARRMFLSYAQALMMQISQTAVCRGRHAIDQQLCRWLLLMLDRLENIHELQMTHDLMAAMLGVRRESITRSAHKLQQAGVIQYVRGRIDIIDRLKLEEHVCECYGVVKLEFVQMLSFIQMPSNRI